MTSSPTTGLPVPGDLQRGNHRLRQEWIESGVFAVHVLNQTLERSDLTGVDVLDVGCGTKIVKTLLDNSLPVGRYVGIDASPTVIDWLKENVSDPRFEFHHLDAHNDLYNPGGTPLGEFDQLPVATHAFDLICLFSVFTHLAPDDYVAMLHLMRRHVRAEGRLVFSLHLNDPDNPSPYALSIEAALASDDPAVVEQAKATAAKAVAAKDRGFLDEIPEQPLLQARYDKDFALELIEGTGWEVMSITPPDRYIQHSMVCRPI